MKIKIAILCFLFLCCISNSFDAQTPKKADPVLSPSPVASAGEKGSYMIVKPVIGNLR